MGMGTSMAMIGAYMVAGELAKARTNDKAEISAALKRYEDGFKPFVRKNQWRPPGVPQVMNPQTKWGVTILHNVLWFMHRSGLSKWLLSDGQSNKEGWKIPDYGWSAARESKQ